MYRKGAVASSGVTANVNISLCAIGEPATVDRLFLTFNKSKSSQERGSVTFNGSIDMLAACVNGPLVFFG